MTSSSSSEPLALLIGAARRRIKQAMAYRLRAHGLSPQQFWLLVVLRESEGLSLRALAERRHMDQPTACRVVTTLTSRGLVKAESDPRDRRRSCLRLTARGIALADRVHPVASRMRTAVTRGLTPEEVSVADRVLRRVMANMERFEGEADRAGSGAGRRRGRSAVRAARAARNGR
jgi:DNA-binding MarR family transcriptional regulator